MRITHRGPDRFAGVRALVSGASSGIGLATSHRLLAEGADLALVARDEARLSRALDELAGSRLSPEQRIVAVRGDLRDPASIAAISERARIDLGGVDLLVNNAGVALPGRAEELDDAAYVDAIDTNYLGAVRLTRALLPGMLSRGRGHVAFVSSLAGVLGVFGYTAYGSSKFALTGYAETLRQELAPRGVGVTLIFPPDTDTAQLAAEAPHKPPETRALAGNIQPLSADRVAAALLDAIAVGRFHAFADVRSRLLVLAHRLAPGLVRRLMDRTVATARTG